MANVVDQIARDGVAKALAMIEQHERVCLERAHESETWRELITGKLDECFRRVDSKLGLLATEVSKIYGHLWKAVFVVVGSLLATIGYLIAHHGL